VSDPIVELFGVSALELFRAQQFAQSRGPLERLPAFMRSGPMQSTDSLCRAYTGLLEVASGKPDDGLQVAVNDVHPQALLRLGLTVYFRDVRRLLPEAPAYTRRLDAALGLYDCSTISAFANAKGSGLPIHHDRHDQLIFQLIGVKRFSYAKNGYVPYPDMQFSPYTAAPYGFGSSYRNGFPLTSQELFERGLTTIELEPGTVIFLPAGLWHTTAEQPEDALSITITVRAPTRLELALNLLGYYASQEPEWRKPAYGGFGTEAAVSADEHAELGALLGELGPRLAALPAAAAYSAHRVHGYSLGTMGEYPRGTRFERYIRLPNSSVRFEDDLTLGKLRCIVKAGPAHRPQAETVLAFHPEARVVVEWILGVSRAFSGSELAEKFEEFTCDDLEELLGWLAHAALIRPLPMPEWESA
jgi:hypothetical protein